MSENDAKNSVIRGKDFNSWPLCMFTDISHAAPIINSSVGIDLHRLKGIF
jgi:hypothetical protein